MFGKGQGEQKRCDDRQDICFKRSNRTFFEYIAYKSGKLQDLVYF